MCANELNSDSHNSRALRVLDLFSGAGGAAMGYFRAFGPDTDIMGVDIKPQPNYPFQFVQMDALAYLEAAGTVSLPFQFDFIHASPPCQLWADGTPDRSIHKDWITPLRPLLLEIGLPYVIENVRRAPLLGHAIQICGGGLGLMVRDYQLHRHRRFESNLPLMGMPCTKQPSAKLTISVVGHGTPSGMRRPDRPDPGVADRRAVMGIDWMTRGELAEAVPPAYTQFLGEQILPLLERVA